MHVRRSGTRVDILTPAKLNLFLEVRERRHDGFHEIETLMVPVALWDSLHFERAESPEIHFRVSRTHGGPPSAESVPEGAENLAVRAISLLRERAGVAQGARLHLVKRIPAAAGMGGGSSDAAAALVAANLGWDVGLAHTQLESLAAELGSDVPFFLGAGPAICRGRGEKVDPVPGICPLHFVVACPPAGLSTAEVYRACRPRRAACTSRDIVKELVRGDVASAGRMLSNGLQLAAASLSPWIDRLQGEFATLDTLGHELSGSGTAYFGICRHARHARRVAAQLRARRVGRVFAVAGTV
jgi:4-diphosphocytidyl-2-C-methyl-D-erythritol kinase